MINLIADSLVNCGGCESDWKRNDFLELEARSLQRSDEIRQEMHYIVQAG